MSHEFLTCCADGVHPDFNSADDTCACSCHRKSQPPRQSETTFEQWKRNYFGDRSQVWIDTTEHGTYKGLPAPIANITEVDLINCWRAALRSQPPQLSAEVVEGIARRVILWAGGIIGNTIDRALPVGSQRVAVNAMSAAEKDLCDLITEALAQRPGRDGR